MRVRKSCRPIAREARRTLQIRATEILQDLFPIGGVVIASKVRLQLATEDLQSRTLSNTVRSDEAKNLSGAGHRKSVQFKAVGLESVGDFGFQVGGQVDDVNRAERALLGTDTTSNAKALGNEGDLGFGRDFDTELSGADDRTRSFTLLATFLWFALQLRVPM